MKKLLTPFSRQVTPGGKTKTDNRKSGGVFSSYRNLRNQMLAVLFLLAAFTFRQTASAQTVITTESGTGFTTGMTFLTGNSFITFVVENTNSYDVLLTGVDQYWDVSNTGTVPTLWYSSTALSGTSTIATPTWTSIATGAAVSVPTSGYYPTLTNLSFVIPAGAQYRFAMQSTNGVYYTGATAPSPTTLSGGGLNLKVHNATIGTGVVGYSGAFPTMTNNPRSFIGRIHFQPAVACTAPPTGGQAVSSINTVCPGTNFNLSLTGASFGLGMTYQWQSSANGTTGWTDITGATTSTLTTSQTATTYYRAQLTCSGQTATSASVQVTTTATAVTGTFTINKNAPASASNFQSFATAISSLSCAGVGGPVVFNVVSGTGPYSEQVVVPAIPGTSATNTVTFNGNGNTVTSSATTGDAFKLDGADYIRVNNLNIQAEPTATSGAIVSLVNGANNNIFSNSTFTHTGSLTSTSTSYGVYVYTGSSNNTFQNNTITGGYYGIYNYGASATINTNNQFTGNTIRDPYYYGVYNYYGTGTLFEGNDISRPTRANAGFFYGMYLTTGSSGVTISKNRIHNTHDAATSTTGTVYAIYVGAAATAGSENIISNNLIYNINASGGSLYALYNTGGSNTYYYYNTVSADNSATSYSTLRGMYFLSGSPNVRFNNNIISLSSQATTKHAIYLSSTAISLQSNNNVLYAPGGNVGYYSTARATLTDWQAANTNAYDQNSVSSNPLFANPAAGSFQPTSGAVNNIGQPVSITQDITGATRSTTTPDPGAYEFTPAATDAGVIAITTLVTGCGLTSQETVTVTIQNFGINPISGFPVSFALNGGTPVTETFTGTIAPGATATFTFAAKANLGTPGTYTVVASTNLAGDMLAVNNATTKVVNAIPNVATFPYFENFENGSGGWVASGANSSWALGTPAGAVINSAASGSNSWTTGLTSDYNTDENSQVLGPCFNFTSLSRPIFEMKAWWFAEGNWDGAVLQSSIDGGATWQLVGALGDPNNWYNDNSLDGRPGGESVGWSGNATLNTTSGSITSGGWVTVKNTLTGLGGRNSVLLRVAFGSDPSVVFDGFAFDDIRIYDTPANDAGVTAITTPVNPVNPGSSQAINVTLKNFGTSTLTSATLGFSVNGTTIVNNYAWTGSLASNQTTTAAFPIGNYTFPAGNFVLKAWSRLPNGAADGNPGNDTTVVNVIACSALTGNYTINKNSAATATNFQSVRTAAEALNTCGISGPVTFTVAANSGPYNEQVEFMTVSGSSATNTITFEGNGNTISASPSTNNPAIIRLFGTDYVTINNFVLTVNSTSSNGWGVQLRDSANNNTISNNIINLPLTSTSTTLGGIMGGSAATTSGSHTSNSRFLNNTINGGYYGITINGATGGLNAVNNQITGNTIKDTYTYNIYLNNTTGTLVERNDISRPTRTSVSTFYGIYLTGTNTSAIISKNRLHNTHDVATSLTGSVYGIYSSSNDAPAGSENIVKNNLIYSINHTGLVYGIYNAGSDGVFYYHNTIDLSNTANTGTVRGFYQLTSATNIEFINNIVSVNSGTTGTKHALYFGTAGSTIVSNNNALYVNPTATNHHIGYYSSNATTLADWKLANNGAYDQNSVSADPQYTNVATGDLTPTNTAINNIGRGTSVTDDIIGLARNTISPDPGAYEFNNNPNDIGVNAIPSPNSICGLTAQETITISVTNYGTVAQSNIPVSYTINGGTPVTATIPGPLAAGASVTYNFSVPANLSATGGYTIVACTGLTNDFDATNNCTTKQVTNSSFGSLPISVDFETPTSGLATVKTVTNSKSALSEGAAASNGSGSTKGLIMEGVTNPSWIIPIAATNPWTNNTDHFSAIYMCFNPTVSTPGGQLLLSFDLKQLYKNVNANTNFRVTVNGTPVGGNQTNVANTYRPPFNGVGGTTVWSKIIIDLTPFAGQSGIEIGFESSVSEEFANGTGTANLIDNIKVEYILGMNEDMLASQLNVYPNPSAGLFNVTLAKGKAFEMEVTDLTGRVIMKQEAKANAAKLDLSKAAKGVYLLKVTSEGTSTVKRVIVE